MWALARRQLPDAQFQALWLRYTEGMNVAEIAQVLRKTRVHVKVLLFRARHALARDLELRAAAAGLNRPGRLSALSGFPVDYAPRPTHHAFLL